MATAILAAPANVTQELGLTFRPAPRATPLMRALRALAWRWLDLETEFDTDVRPSGDDEIPYTPLQTPDREFA
jgi:hypothetical protein